MEGQGHSRMPQFYRYLDAGMLFMTFLCSRNDYLTNYESLVSSLSAVQVSPQIALSRPIYTFLQDSGRVFLGPAKLPQQVMSW
jgi:hypothetical protein